MWLPGNPLLRRFTLMLMDALLLTAGLALNLEIWVRFREGAMTPEYIALFAHVVLPIVALKLLLFAWLGLYRAMARHTGNYEIMMIALGATIASAVIVIFNFATHLIPSLGTFPLSFDRDSILRIPWGVVFNDWMLTLITVGGVRLLRREIQLGLLRFRSASGLKPVLIVGAGDAGEQVARDLIRSTGGLYRPVAFVDPDPALKGIRIHGIPVAGTLDDLERVIERHQPREIVIALQQPTPRVLRRIVDHCRTARLEFRIVPALTSVMAGRIEVSTLRPVEIEDLLGREPVDLETGGRPAYLSGKRVLVTGAGGSIGRELCRQAMLQKPEAVILLGRGENSLFEAMIDLRPLAEEGGVRLDVAIGDIRDEALIERVFTQHKPRVVFHAAAHKHVHFMEAQPAEAVKNNVRGTLAVARAAQRAAVERFILISTDKAVRPTGAMGASKRAAEMIVSAIDEQAEGTFVSVRFGNVLGSRGSVIPTFRRQIEQGGPVTVTHPEVTRYFMTTSEAVSLVIQAGAQGRGGELYVLDMGRPIRIADLARNLITLSGLEPEIDIPIVFTGMRPGEKLTEELLTQDENVTATEMGKIFVARHERRSMDALAPVLERLFAAAEAGDDAAVREIFRELIPDYKTADLS